MKIILCICLFLLMSVVSYSQNKQNSKNKSELETSNYFDYEKRWQYFQLTDTIRAKIIEHIPAPAACGILATASKTIVVTEKGDSIRIIDMCNISDYFKANQMVTIVPANKPQFGLTLPFTLIENPQTNQLEPLGYDLYLLKTTWGNLLKEEK